MIRVETRAPDGTRQRHTFEQQPEVWIGRSDGCDVVLASELVSRRHVCIRIDGPQLLTRDASANGTLVDGRPLHGDQRPVGNRVSLTVGPYRLDARLSEEPATDQAARRRRFRHAVLEEIDLSSIDRDHMEVERLRPQVDAALQRLCADEPDAATLVPELIDEVLGLGPLQALLEDAEVSEIMVVDPETIYVERSGRMQRTSLRFTDEIAVRSAMERIVSPLGRRIDESTPMVDARLPDGSRVNAIIPPLARRGPCITIRKFQRAPLTFARLVELESLDESMADFLCECVRAKRNIVISGGTGSGKTTLLNVLSSAIGGDERVITIEDAAELQLSQPHVVSLESRPDNLEGKGAYSIGDLLRNALRMRPDRIIVGECRGAEAIEMLQAMNTGHDGSMTTTHANDPWGAVRRLEVLCLMAGLDIPAAAIRHQIATSVDVIVQQARLHDGSRRITSIAEVSNVDARGHVRLNELFTLRAKGALDSAEFRPTGRLPTLIPRVPSAEVGP